MSILWRSYGRDTKSDVEKHAFSAILVPFIAPKRPFALPCARHPPQPRYHGHVGAGGWRCGGQEGPLASAGLLEAKNTRFGGISMFFFRKMDF